MEARALSTIIGLFSVRYRYYHREVMFAHREYERPLSRLQECDSGRQTHVQRLSPRSARAEHAEAPYFLESRQTFTKTLQLGTAFWRLQAQGIGRLQGLLCQCEHCECTYLEFTVHTYLLGYVLCTDRLSRRGF